GQFIEHPLPDREVSHRRDDVAKTWLRLSGKAKRLCFSSVPLDHPPVEVAIRISKRPVLPFRLPGETAKELHGLFHVPRDGVPLSTQKLHLGVKIARRFQV